MVEIKGTVSVIYAGQTTAVAFLYVHTFRLKTEIKLPTPTQLRKQMRDFRLPISDFRFPTTDFRLPTPSFYEGFINIYK